MGYSSDVVFTVYGPLEQMTRLIATERVKRGSPLNLYPKDYSIERFVHSHHTNTTLEHVFLIFKRECAAWHPEYEDVKAWVKFFDDVAEKIESEERTGIGSHYLGVHVEITNTFPDFVSKTDEESLDDEA